MLENDNLIIETKALGGELTRIYSKKYNKEILWNADKKYWGRHSPILFPIVGKLKDDETIIENKTYNMTQHGFARDSEFEIIEDNEKFISYKLTSSNKTKKLYPYDFELLITYTILENGVSIKWSVKNTDSKKIYFSIGAHPAFNIGNINDYYLEFKKRNNTCQIVMEPPYHNEINDINLKNLELDAKTFKGDALIYTNVDAINLKNKNEKEYLKVSFENFPLVGIWTPYYKETNSTAPFLCIEPWYGLCDNINSDKIYKNKKYINSLEIGESFETSYKIEII